MDQQLDGTLTELTKLNNSEFDTIPNTCHWFDYFPLIRDLCIALGVLRAKSFDSGHPLLLALDRLAPDMTKDDRFFVENVIGFYQEQLGLQQIESR